MGIYRLQKRFPDGVYEGRKLKLPKDPLDLSSGDGGPAQKSRQVSRDGEDLVFGERQASCFRVPKYPEPLELPGWCEPRLQ